MKIRLPRAGGADGSTESTFSIVGWFLVTCSCLFQNKIIYQKLRLMVKPVW